MEQKDSAERILKQIPYEIVYSARKTLAVQVKAEAWWCAHRNGWQNTKSKHS